MTTGILTRILGDFGPFSRMGKSIGYQIEIGDANYLIDCGAPLFQQIGGHGLKKILGVLITHCHDDHKRWFSDLALFNRYARDFLNKVSLITSEGVYEDLVEASRPALETSLSPDSAAMIDIPCEEYINYIVIGPRALYRIVRTATEEGGTRLSVKDRHGNIIGPDRAKIIISNKTGRPRLLFKDPHYGEWVEPDSFYPYSSRVFYEEDKNILKGEGFEIEAVKAPVWHGVKGTGFRVRTKDESVVFSSDTAHNLELWKRLYSEKRPLRLSMPQAEFDRASVIHGDINDYIERTWSEERYREAVGAFEGAVVIHDVSVLKSVVHTDYERLGNTCLKKESVLLTHSPDRITSEWMLCNAGKTFLIKGGGLMEVVDGRLYPMNADIYHKEAGKYYAGYRSATGKYTVYEKDGLLRFRSEDGSDVGRPLYKVDLYEDIAGKYFPRIDRTGAFYHERPDGRIEVVEYTEDGSHGTVVEDLRDRLLVK